MTSEWLCEQRSPPGNDGPVTTGDKRSYVKEKKTREERKKSGVENRAFKGLRSDKGTERGKCRVERGEMGKSGRKKEKRYKETAPEMFQVETAGPGGAGRGTVR